MAQAQKLTRRFLAPPQGAAGLEMIHQPLFSSAALDAAALPREVLFFNYGIGATISGAGAGAIAANRFHTNMDTANFLAAPKTFTVSGVRVLVLPLAYGASPALADDTAGTGNSDMFDDLLLIHDSGIFEFSVGPKTYVQGPLWLLPGNVGLEGVAAVSASSTAAAAVGAQIEAFHTVGRYYAMPTYPVLISNQQNFGAKLNFLFPVNPTIVDTKLVQVFLDGLLGREVS